MLEPQSVTPWASWASYDAQTPQQCALLRVWGGFVLDMRQNSQARWLSLLGASGNGKTHLAKRAFRWADEIGVREYPGRHATWCHWPEYMEQARGGNYGWRDDLKQHWFVALDDVGAERDNSGFAREELTKVLESRLGKWTILTSNLVYADFEAYDKRIASRMKRGGSVVFQTNWKDYNQQ